MPDAYDRFRDMLLEEQARIKQAIARSSLPRLADDPASLDDGSYRAEEDRSIGLRLQQVELLEEVEHALRKLEDGSYGACDVCGQRIPEERLAIRPQAASCVGCKGRPHAQ